MDDDLFLKPEDAPHDSLADPLRSQVGEQFWDLIVWHLNSNQFNGNPAFEQDGSALLIRGEY